MKVIPVKNGVSIVPETDFEREYLGIIFTLNDNRKVIFDYDSRILKVFAVDEDER